MILTDSQSNKFGNGYRYLLEFETKFENILGQESLVFDLKQRMGENLVTQSR
jgi:hypothetical protein